MTAKKKSKSSAKSKPPGLREQLQAAIRQVVKAAARVRDSDERPRHPAYDSQVRKQERELWKKPGYREAKRLVERSLDDAVKTVLPKVAAKCPTLTTVDATIMLEELGFVDTWEYVEDIVLGERRKPRAPGQGVALGRLFGSTATSAKKSTKKTRRATKRAKKAPKKSSKKKATAKAKAKPRAKAKTAARSKAKPKAKSSAKPKTKTKAKQSVEDRIVAILDGRGHRMKPSEVRSELGTVSGRRFQQALLRLVERGTIVQDDQVGLELLCEADQFLSVLRQRDASLESATLRKLLGHWSDAVFRTVLAELLTMGRIVEAKPGVYTLPPSSTSQQDAAE